MTETLIGKIFNERYKLTERVGLGGMAEVYRATDIVLGRTVAVKIMLPQYAADEEFSDRFRQEAAAAANLNSPYIVNIYDWGQDGGTSYIVMEYIRGADLKSGIKQRGALNSRKIAQIAEQVCQALTVAHKQDIIHRDIKPQNIMIQPDGNIKVMDFGIAQAKNSVKTATGSVLGTAHYISPEQAQGKELGAASDLYSLGVVMYECATGSVPFDGPDAVSVAVKQVKEAPVEPVVLNPNVDEGLESIILRAMEKDPARRYRSATQMREALLALLAGTPIDGFGNPISADAAATVVLGGDVASAFAGGAGAGVGVGVGAHGAHAAQGSHAHAYGVRGYDDYKYGFDAGAGAGAGVGAGAGGAMVGATQVLGTGPVTSAQAAARARIAARNHAASTGALYTSADPSGTVRRVSAHDAAYDGPRRGKLGIILGVAAVAIALVVGVLLLLGQGVGEVPNTAPSVMGKSQSEATKVIKAAGYEVGEVTKEFSDDVDTGYVISQTPVAGSPIEPGAAIDLVVSKGKELVSVPAITGKTVTELQDLLAAAGLTARAGEATYSSTVETNLVISQDPIAGAKVEKGSAVTYVLSLGVDYVTVPDVTEKPLAEARRMLAAAGFETIFEQHEFSTTVEKDTVIRQSPSGGTKLERKGAVTIIVSDGKEMVTIPNVVGMSMKQATSTLLAAGLSVSKSGNTADDAEVIEQSPVASPSTSDKDKVEKQTVVTIVGKAEELPPPVVEG